jgi:LemA protein
VLVFGAIVGAVLWFAMAYNNLVAAAHRANQSWGNVDDLLRQRHDEIPKLIELCQPNLKYEQATFDRALEARSEVFGARQTQDVAALGHAESVLRGEVQHLLGLASANAELGADPTLAALQQRLATLETGIVERGELYNDAVRQNNLALRRFPGSIVAILGGFRRLHAFVLDAGRTPPARDPPSGPA